MKNIKNFGRIFSTRNIFVNVKALSTKDVKMQTTDYVGDKLYVASPECRNSLANYGHHVHRIDHLTGCEVQQRCFTVP